MEDIAPNLKAIERLERLVQETILNGPRGVLPRGCRIVADISNMEDPVRWRYDYNKWHTIRDEVSGGVASIGGRRFGAIPWIEHKKKFSHAITTLSNKVCERFLKYKPYKVCEDIDVDMKIIFYFLHFGAGEEGPLPELILKTYEAGGFPCGWVGKYPKGNLVVYWPYDQEPQFEDA